MKIVRIINGTYGYRPYRSGYVIPVSAGDPPISLEDAKADALVAAGVAVYVEEANEAAKQVETVVVDESATVDLPDKPNEEPNEDAPEEPDATADENTDDDPEEPVLYHIGMRVDDLRAAMKEQGLTVKVGMTKQAMVDALNAAPDLSAEDVVE